MNALPRPLLIALLLLGLCSPEKAMAANQVAHDQTMQDSLSQFFARGIIHQGATAELAEVIRWPNAHGRMTWRLPHISRYPARLSLIAEQRQNGKLQRWYVPVRVHWWAKVMVARRDIPARTRLNASQLKLQRTDMAGVTASWWQHPAALNGTRSTRPIAAGKAVLSSYITRPSLLKHGDRITLIAHIGGVQVMATGKVLKNAGAGDRVRVQNLRSKEIVQATIIDAHHARVESGGA
ncbi:MAG: flagellar basal body P-ring formation chaperone FlgA [Mariprofundaceae bacterium]